MFILLEVRIQKKIVRFSHRSNGAQARLNLYEILSTLGPLRDHEGNIGFRVYGLVYFLIYSLMANHVHELDGWLSKL